MCAYVAVNNVLKLTTDFSEAWHLHHDSADCPALCVVSVQLSSFYTRATVTFIVKDHNILCNRLNRYSKNISMQLLINATLCNVVWQSHQQLDISDVA
jgi:hypothetical protein